MCNLSNSVVVRASLTNSTTVYRKSIVAAFLRNPCPEPPHRVLGDYRLQLIWSCLRLAPLKADQQIAPISWVRETHRVVSSVSRTPAIVFEVAHLRPIQARSASFEVSVLG